MDNQYKVERTVSRETLDEQSESKVETTIMCETLDEQSESKSETLYNVYGVLETDSDSKYVVKFLTYDENKHYYTILANGYLPHIYVKLPDTVNEHLFINKLEDTINIKVLSYNCESWKDFSENNVEQIFLKINFNSLCEHKRTRLFLQYNQINFGKTKIKFRVYDSFLSPMFYCHMKYNFGNIITIKNANLVTQENDTIKTSLDNLSFKNVNVNIKYAYLEEKTNKIYFNGEEKLLTLSQSKVIDSEIESIINLSEFMEKNEIRCLFHEDKYDRFVLQNKLNAYQIKQKWIDVLIDNQNKQEQTLNCIHYKIKNIMHESQICDLPQVMVLYCGIMKKIIYILTKRAYAQKYLIPSSSDVHRCFESQEQLEKNISTAIIHNVQNIEGNEMLIGAGFFPFKTSERIILYKKQDTTYIPAFISKICRKYKNKITLKHKYYRKKSKKTEVEQLYVIYRTITFRGGMKIEPTIHLSYEPIIVLDFASLYPSIIIKYNISNEYNPLITTLIKEWVELRKTNPTMGSVYKQFANAFFGQFGSLKSPLYNYFNADYITAKGRELLQQAKNIVEQIFKFEVVYGNTDSLFIKVNDVSPEFINKIVDKINNDVDPEGIIKIKYERTFQPFYVHKKNRYFGLVDNKPQITGFRKEHYATINCLLDKLTKHEINVDEIEKELTTFE